MDLFRDDSVGSHADDEELVGDDADDSAEVGDEERHKPEVAGGGEGGEGHLPERGQEPGHEVHGRVHRGSRVGPERERDDEDRETNLGQGE